MRNSSGIYSISEVPSFVKGFRKMTDQDFDPRTREGCDMHRLQRVPRSADFNPRTREGCDVGIRPRLAQRLVSIHAPARGATFTRSRKLVLRGFQSTHPMRGATCTGCNVYRDRLISIHAPARGATVCPPVAQALVRAFQSTHPRGVRQLMQDRLIAEYKVSIHAPARGATSRRTRKARTLRRFQSTHPRGVRRFSCSVR